MSDQDEAFYDDLANAYHLLFEDWNASIERQTRVLRKLIMPPADGVRILDCACGIGTQALGLAAEGYLVDGTDLSSAAIDRAKLEAAARNLEIAFRVDDLRELQSCPLGAYDVVLALDNALPHLDSDEELIAAFAAMHERLKPAGKLLVSLRDYSTAIVERPAMQPPAFYSDEGRRRFIHQIWDWQDERRYVVHLFITRELEDGRWESGHHRGRYRAVLPKEIAAHAEGAGFKDIQILQPEVTGHYQPIVSATRR